VRPSTRILDEVCDLRTRHPEIDASDIEVDVRPDGVVVLTGSVPDRRSKRLADDIAGEVWGVRDVDNRLTLAPA
jgi:osmotically-inducible protein OsmY